MPRRSSWWRDEERARDKYYEYLDEACDCRYGYVDEDGNWVEDDDDEPCQYCRRRARLAHERAQRLAHAEQMRAEAAAAAYAARVAANPDSVQMVAIKGFLDRVAAIQGAGREAERVAVVRELFTYLLTVGDFLKKHAKFRQAVRNKIAEFRADEHAVSLLPLFSQVEEMLAQLEAPAPPPSDAAIPPEEAGAAAGADAK